MKPVFLTFILLAPFLLSSCAAKKKLKYREQHRYVPAEFTNIYLGMPLADMLKIRKNMEKEEQGMDIRIAYKEDINRDRIKNVVYYFGPSGDNPLYELIIEFDTVEERDAVVDYRFGRPNHLDSEWMFDSKEGFMIHAWKFQNKLVIVGKIKDTE